MIALKETGKNNPWQIDKNMLEYFWIQKNKKEGFNMSKVVTLRLSEEEYKRISVAAGIEHRPISNFITTRVLKEIEESYYLNNAWRWPFLSLYRQSNINMFPQSAENKNGHRADKI